MNSWQSLSAPCSIFTYRVGRSGTFWTVMVTCFPKISLNVKIPALKLIMEVTSEAGIEVGGEMLGNGKDIFLV